MLSLSRLRRYGIGLGLLAASLIVHIVVYILNPDDGGGNSRAFLGLAGAVSVYCLALIGAAAWLTRTRPDALERLRERIRALHLPYTLGAAAVCLAFGWFMRPEWVYAHMGIALAFGLAFGYLVLYGHRPPPIPARWAVIGGIAGVAGVTFVRIWGATAYPFLINIDEPWDFSWAYSFVRTGRLSDWMMVYGGGDIEGFLILPGLWMRLVGVGYWEMRVFMLLLTFPLIALCALAACNLYDRITGWLTAALMFGGVLVMSMATTRHDIGLATAMAASLWLYALAARRGDERLYAASGLAIGLGLFTHYHATIFGVTFTLAFFLPRWIERARAGQWLPERALILFVTGGLAGAGIVFAVQIVPQWDGFVAKRLDGVQSLGGNSFRLEQYAAGFFRHIEHIGHYSQFTFLLTAISVIGLVARRARGDITLLLCMGIGHALLPVITGLNFALLYYVLPFTVFYSIAAAALFTQSLRSGAKPPAASPHNVQGNRLLHITPPTPLIMGGLVALIGLGVTIREPALHVLQGNPPRPPAPPAAQYLIERLDPAADTLVSSHYYFLWLHDYRFVSPEAAHLIHRQYSDQFPDNGAFWRAVQPTYVVIDRNLSECCPRQPIFDPDWLAANGYTLDTEIPGERVPIQLYRRAGG
ncbi:MAG: glycosyltransferase family 39 protein [bacterium]|nr:glycosyltransferase family 39 protein [bacterium]